jgi:predicted Zn-dependent protease
VAGVKRGFLITRFHYVNILDRPQALLTGMTRDGTFEIVDGEVGRGVRNLRFSQSALDALDSVVGIGKDLVARAPEYGGFGSTVAPALRIGEFRFSSAALH